MTGNRVEYRRTQGHVGSPGGLVEWYINGSDGLEQGFDLERRPLTEAEATGAIETAAPLELLFDVSAPALPTRTVRADEVTFRSADGATVLSLAKLHAFDAEGAALPISFDRRGSRLSIVLDDRNAVYPVTIDPLITGPAAELRVEGTVEKRSLRHVGRRRHGRGLGWSAGTLEWRRLPLRTRRRGVGAHREDRRPRRAPGPALRLGRCPAGGLDGDRRAGGQRGRFPRRSRYLYERAPGTGEWEFDLKLLAKRPRARRVLRRVDRFRRSRPDRRCSRRGCHRDQFRCGVRVLHVQRRMEPVRAVDAPAAHAHAYFGRSVDASGTRLAIGAPGNTGSDGWVDVFQFHNGLQRWELEQSFTHGSGGNFGEAVALDGPWLVIGGPKMADGEWSVASLRSTGTREVPSQSTPCSLVTTTGRNTAVPSPSTWRVAPSIPRSSRARRNVSPRTRGMLVPTSTLAATGSRRKSGPTVNKPRTPSSDPRSPYTRPMPSSARRTASPGIAAPVRR